MKKRNRELVKKAADFISALAENNYESNADLNGFVESRTAWNEIKAARKLAKQLAAIARGEKA